MLLNSNRNLIILVLISSLFSLDSKLSGRSRRTSYGSTTMRSKVTKPVPPTTVLVAATIRRHINKNVGELDLAAKDLFTIIRGIIKHFTKTNDPVTWEAARLNIFNTLLKKRLADTTSLQNDYQKNQSHYHTTYGISSYQEFYNTLKTLVNASTSLQNDLRNTDMCTLMYLKRSFSSVLKQLKAQWPRKLVKMIEQEERQTNSLQLIYQVSRKPLA